MLGWLTKIFNKGKLKKSQRVSFGKIDKVLKFDAGFLFFGSKDFFLEKMCLKGFEGDMLGWLTKIFEKEKLKIKSVAPEEHKGIFCQN